MQLLIIRCAKRIVFHFGKRRALRTFETHKAPECIPIQGCFQQFTGAIETDSGAQKHPVFKRKATRIPLQHHRIRKCFHVWINGIHQIHFKGNIIRPDLVSLRLPLGAPFRCIQHVLPTPTFGQHAHICCLRRCGCSVFPRSRRTASKNQ